MHQELDRPTRDEGATQLVVHGKTGLDPPWIKQNGEHRRVRRPTYRFVYRPTPSPNTTPFPGPNAPEIDEIDLSDATLVPPANIYGRVLTNPSVVTVTAETMGTTLTIPKVTPGVFGLSASIPDVPQFLRNRSFDVTFTATVSDGRIASVTIPLTIR